MSNILRLKKTGDAVNVATIDANAIIDTLAREINKEKKQVTTAKGRTKRQEHRNNKISRNNELE